MKRWMYENVQFCQYREPLIRRQRLSEHSFEHLLSDPGPIIVRNSLTHSLTTCWHLIDLTLGYIDAYVGKDEKLTNMKICELCKICKNCKRCIIIKRCWICRLWKTKATKSMLRNQKYRTKYAKLSLPIQTYQTKPAKPNTANQAYQNKHTKHSLLN